jgi:RNA polymerase primary sigma factor
MTAISAYFRDISKIDVLTSEEQTALALRAQKGDIKSRQRLIETNLKFVVSIARQYVGQGIPLEDLISEGNFGISKAIDGFNPKKETKFLTYASWWIRQCILQSLTDTNRQIRLPANRIGIIQRYNKAAAQMEQDLHRDVKETEIFDELGIDSSELIRQSSISYFTETDDGTMLMDLIPNLETESPDAELMKASVTQELDTALGKIGEREAVILRMYYGFGHPRSYTLEEIGEKLNLTRERIRQLRNKAVRDLRRLDRRKQLENLKD